MGKKRKLRKWLRKREAEHEPALVVCVGKDCASRDQSRAVAEAARTRAEGSAVRVILTNCLHVCKKGPIAATSPDVSFHKRVDEDGARALIDGLIAVYPRA